jgi:hypothetical protein
MTKSDPNSIWLYNAKVPLAIAIAVLYSVPMIIQLYQTLFRLKAYFFLLALFGVCLEVGGYVVRAVSIKNPDSIVRAPPFFSISAH